MLRYSFNETSYFYEYILKKEKIQNAMEQKAINQVLQRIIGDELFINGAVVLPHKSVKERIMIEGTILM